MQIAAEATTTQSLLSATLSEFTGPFMQYLFSPHAVIRRNGAIAASESSCNVRAAAGTSSRVNNGQRAASAEACLRAIGSRIRKPDGLQGWSNLAGFALVADSTILNGLNAWPQVGPGRR